MRPIDIKISQDRTDRRRERKNLPQTQAHRLEAPDSHESDARTSGGFSLLDGLNRPGKSPLKSCAIPYSKPFFASSKFAFGGRKR